VHPCRDLGQPLLPSGVVHRGGPAQLAGCFVISTLAPCTPASPPTWGAIGCTAPRLVRLASARTHRVWSRCANTFLRPGPAARCVALSASRSWQTVHGGSMVLVRLAPRTLAQRRVDGARAPRMPQPRAKYSNLYTCFFIRPFGRWRSLPPLLPAHPEHMPMSS
jgi:hypothetical protein